MLGYFNKNGEKSRFLTSNGGASLSSLLRLGFCVLIVAASSADGGELALENELQAHLPFFPYPSTYIGNGNLTFVKNSSVITWNFDDSAVPLADAFGHGSEMAVNGTGLSVVNDATRGNVLSFDGTAYLEGPGTDASLDGLPAGGVNLPFTVAFWIKPDSDCPKEAGLVYWGQAIARKQMLIRFNDGAKKLLFSVYGNGEAIYPAAATVFFYGLLRWCARFESDHWRQLRTAKQEPVHRKREQKRAL